MSNTTLEIDLDCTIDASGAPVLTPVSTSRLDTTTTPWELVLHPLDTSDTEDEDVTFSITPPSGYSLTVSSSGTPSGAWTQDGSTWVSASIDLPQDHGIVVNAVPDSNPEAPPASSTTTIKLQKPGRPFSLAGLPLARPTVAGKTA